jgi:hypothetical protein
VSRRHFRRIEAAADGDAEPEGAPEEAYIFVGPNVGPSRYYPGVDAVITNFSDLPKFSAKKLAFCLNDPNFARNYVAIFLVKTPNFYAKFFRRKYFYNHNIGPRSRLLKQNSAPELSKPDLFCNPA